MTSNQFNAKVNELINNHPTILKMDTYLDHQLEQIQRRRERNENIVKRLKQFGIPAKYAYHIVAFANLVFTVVVSLLLA